VIALLALLHGALPGDTLRLGPGVHPGPLVLDRPTVVLGEPGAILRGTGRGTVLEIRAAARGSVVRGGEGGLRIERSGRDPDHYDAAVHVAADSTTLENLEIRDVLFGVVLEHVRGATLRDLDIEGPHEGRESDRGDGILLYDSRALLVASCRIAYMRDGIYFSYSDSVQVRDNRVSRVRFGLHYMFSHQNLFAHNVFTDNAAGAVIMNSRGVAVTDNVFAWNAGSRSYGLVLQTATDPVVRDNVVVGNGIGVFFDNVVRGDFRGNLVAGNWLGLELFANSEATLVVGNALAGNTFDTRGGGGGGGGEAYRFCDGGRGNYWAAATDGYDLDGDGVLDAPYAAGSPLAELSRDREGLRLFLGSPAARVLEWAERTFPVFDAGGAVDPCPLAAPPRAAMLGRMPAAPAAAIGGLGGQRLAGGGLLLLGIGLLALAAPRRAAGIAA
jgi:nitrous oxidase accessory protein